MVDRVFLGDSSDAEFVKGLDIPTPRCIIADVPYGTAKRREGRGGSYGDGKSQAHTFAEGMLEVMHDIMPDDGTIWLFCDHRSNYIYRQYLNRIFGERNFLNEVAWFYASGGRPKRTMAQKHDTIFWYARNASSDYTYNLVREKYRSLKDGEVRDGFHPDGKPITSAWDIGIIGTSAHERVAYPTQKNVKLMERMITISSNPGDVVWDPCVGSGTTIEAALKLGREGFGIDINPEAVRISKERLAGLEGAGEAA